MVRSIVMSGQAERPEDAYRGFVNGERFSAMQDIPDIQLNMGGVARPAYGLDIFAGEYPQEGAPYRAVSLEQSGAPLDEAQRARISNLLAMGYPQKCAQAFFAEAGVDASELPELTDRDAAAVMQMAVWAIQAGGTVFFEFLNTDEQSLHSKHTRLSAACAYYYALPEAKKQAPVYFGQQQLMVLPDAGGAFRVGPITLCCDDANARIRLSLLPRVPGAELADAKGNPLDGPPLNTPFFLKMPSLTQTQFSLTAQVLGDQSVCLALVHQQQAVHPDILPLVAAFPPEEEGLYTDTAWFELIPPEQYLTQSDLMQSASGIPPGAPQRNIPMEPVSATPPAASALSPLLNTAPHGTLAGEAASILPAAGQHPERARVPAPPSPYSPGSRPISKQPASQAQRTAKQPLAPPSPRPITGQPAASPTARGINRQTVQAQNIVKPPAPPSPYARNNAARPSGLPTTPSGKNRQTAPLRSDSVRRTSLPISPVERRSADPVPPTRGGRHWPDQ